MYHNSVSPVGLCAICEWKLVVPRVGGGTKTTDGVGCLNTLLNSLNEDISVKKLRETKLNSLRNRVAQQRWKVWHSSTHRYYRYWLSTYSVRTCTASTPGRLVAHPPGTLVCHLCQFHLLILDSHPLLCGSLRYHIQLFPSVPFIFTTTSY